MGNAEFIKKATVKHKNKYDYSKTKYISIKKKVIITCNEHGDFLQTPNDHLYSGGCQKCAGNKSLTTNEFIKKANMIHNNKYKYEKSVYKNTHSKIIITCKIHGDFEIRPSCHILKKRGCQKCNHTHGYTTNEYIDKITKIHGKKYDYSKVKFKDIYSNITIICNEHGEFKQRSYNHLKGSGCQKCARNKSLTTNKFIKKAIEVHKNIYNYDNVIYKNNKTKINIKCKIHGLFAQSPNGHLSGKGCSKCAINKNALKQTCSTKEFISKAKNKYGDKYDYSNVIYVNARTDIIIICNTCNTINQQTPDQHLRNDSCMMCNKFSKKNTQEIFIKKANKIHNNKYDYSKLLYVDKNSKIYINCKLHGTFSQLANVHLRGHGCKKCSNNKLRKDRQKSIKQFIKESIDIYGDKYDYSESIYINCKKNIKFKCNLHNIKFEQSATNHLKGKMGCPKCSNNGTSKIAQEWIDLLLVKQPELRHFYHEKGEFNIPKTNYKADAYNKETKTIYEFHGDFWHGNSEVFNHKLMNNVCKKTFGQLYKKTMKKQRECEELGYTYKSIWENDWIKGKMALKRIQNNFRKKQMLKKFPYQCEKCNYECKFKSEYDRHCNSELHKTGKRGIKKNKVNRVCQICKLYEASCNTNMKNHILINHKTSKDREKEYPNYCKTCDYGSFSKKIFDKHLTTKKHKKKEDIVNKLKDVD